MQLLFFSFLLRFLFYGTRRGVNGALFGALGVLVGVVFIFVGAVLFYIGVVRLHRGGFVYIGVVLFTLGWLYFRRGVKLLLSGRQNGDMWHRYDAVLQQIAVMKQ